MTNEIEELTSVIYECSEFRQNLTMEQTAIEIFRYFRDLAKSRVIDEDYLNAVLHDNETLT